MRPVNPVTPFLEAQITLGLQIPKTRMVTVAKEPSWVCDPLFKHLHRFCTSEGVIDLNGDSVNCSPSLGWADSFDTTFGIVYGALVEKLVRALNISVGDIDPEKPLYALGMGSLVSVELRNWIFKHLDIDVAVFDLMEVSSLQALEVLIELRSRFVT
ncbi:hypothetical protein F5Y03DRAFT_406428 [Xylaria venustula]|nr:hypothetical protein F5Y03DRAFT_406428 [Xylaria venustula]